MAGVVIDAVRRHVLRRPLAGEAVVLLYHRVTPGQPAEGGMSVSPAAFDEHLSALRARFRPLHLAELVQALTDRVLPRRSVVITFDDGYVDNLTEAKPLLERHGVPATVFVVSGYVGSGQRFWMDELWRICLAPPRLPDRLELKVGGETRTWRVPAGAGRRDLYRMLRDTLGSLGQQERDELLTELGAWGGAGPPDAAETLDADQLRQLADGELIEIGAHTMTHPFLPSVPRKRQLEEIRGSVRQLEELLDRDIRLFSYPFGAHDRTTVAQARYAGVTCACTTVGAAVHASTDPYRLPRLSVHEWSGEELVEKVASRLG